MKEIVPKVHTCRHQASVRFLRRGNLQWMSNTQAASPACCHHGGGGVHISSIEMYRNMTKACIRWEVEGKSRTLGLQFYVDLQGASIGNYLEATTVPRLDQSHCLPFQKGTHSAAACPSSHLDRHHFAGLQHSCMEESLHTTCE